MKHHKRAHQKPRTPHTAPPAVIPVANVAMPTPQEAADAAALQSTREAVSQMPSVVGGKLEATQVSETPHHAKRRLRGVVPPQGADAALFIPPARIKHIPPPMKGTYASLVHQNKMANADHVGRIEDDDDLVRMRQAKLLVPIPVTAVLRVNPELAANRRYTRPWTARFLRDISRAHYQRYHSYIQVNSAVRTAAFQRALLRVNGNAAPAEGDIASPHLTGQTVDIAKKGLSSQEVAWMRLYLAPLQRAGKIDVAEEFQQACFHISVYKSYLPAVKSGSGVTTTKGRTSSKRAARASSHGRNSSVTLLAARMR
jgi:hypothetical protein